VPLLKDTDSIESSIVVTSLYDSFFNNKYVNDTKKLKKCIRVTNIPETTMKHIDQSMPGTLVSFIKSYYDRKGYNKSINKYKVTVT